ncbi:hypothetical protein QJS04_geneDACA006819 [Acorus gramineus]|uniref:Uncharacterized protein n=1 Tax=Acorus gramineus TaxID=55184 RepID=A0AAV9AYM4_ACOGR|nr:hypothetical protein QJS04_geneDACA006819 [Acorus gramineus]
MDKTFKEGENKNIALQDYATLSPERGRQLVKAKNVWRQNMTEQIKNKKRTPELPLLSDKASQPSNQCSLLILYQSKKSTDQTVLNPCPCCPSSATLAV